MSARGSTSYQRSFAHLSRTSALAINPRLLISSSFIFVLLSLLLITSLAHAQDRPRLRIVESSSSLGKIHFRIVAKKRNGLNGKRVLLRLKRSSVNGWEAKVRTSRLRRGRKAEIAVSNLPPGLYVAQAKLKQRGEKSGWSPQEYVSLAPPSQDSTPPDQAQEDDQPSTSHMPDIATPLSECAPGIEDQVLEQINIERAADGLNPLVRDQLLDISARLHSMMMAENQDMTHDGWFEIILSTGYQGSSLGQNIAKYIQDPVVLVDAWMGSDGHRLNILKPNYSEIGISCVRAADGEYYWTNNFGTP